MINRAAVGYLNRGAEHGGICKNHGVFLLTISFPARRPDDPSVAIFAVAYQKDGLELPQPPVATGRFPGLQRKNPRFF